MVGHDFYTMQHVIAGPSTGSHEGVGATSSRVRLALSGELAAHHSAFALVEKNISELG